MSVEEREFQIDDPDELSQKTRIRELLARRTDVIDARDHAFDAMTLGQATEKQALGFYYRRIQSLIIDLWTQFKNEEIDVGEEYLTGKPIDTIRIPPPEELQDAQDIATGESVPDAKQKSIKGLLWFVNNEPVVSAKFTVETWNPPGESTYVSERAIPPRTLDKALMRCMEFIDETGIDANLSQQEQQTKIDRKLLEEVEQWRQKNVTAE